MFKLFLLFLYLTRINSLKVFNLPIYINNLFSNKENLDIPSVTWDDGEIIWEDIHGNSLLNENEYYDSATLQVQNNIKNSSYYTTYIEKITDNNIFETYENNYNEVLYTLKNQVINTENMLDALQDSINDFNPELAIGILCTYTLIIHIYDDSERDTPNKKNNSNIHTNTITKNNIIKPIILSLFILFRNVNSCT